MISDALLDIFVPPERVMDTVDIYFIRERSRRLNLRFLTYCVLKEEIQIDTHDSIEDARAALLLHRKFQEREAAGDWEALLREVYAEGKKLVRSTCPVLIAPKATYIVSLRIGKHLKCRRPLPLHP